MISGRTTNASDHTYPRIVTLGGDHTTTLSALRSTHERWGAVSVIHFDSPLGTSTPAPKTTTHQLTTRRHLGPQDPRRRHNRLRVKSHFISRSLHPPTDHTRPPSSVNHGTFLHIAHEEGLIRNTSIHAGIRAPVANKKYDLRHDKSCGFDIVTARALDRIGTGGVIQRLKDRVEGTRVYISVDIDVLDPAFAPGESAGLL